MINAHVPNAQAGEPLQPKEQRRERKKEKARRREGEGGRGAGREREIIGEPEIKRPPPQRSAHVLAPMF
jgi:hypothetical protein